jgi:hypothetical protein
MNGTRGLVIAVIASLIVGFSLGLVSGIFTMRFCPVMARPFGDGPRHERMMGPGPPRGGPMGGRGLPGGPLLEHMTRELDLSVSQRDSVRAILERVHEHQAAWHDSARVAIERVLTAPQRERWRQLQTRFRETWRGRTGRPLPDDGRPTGGDPHEGEGR